MANNLRKRIPISYCDFEEPRFDEYVYCDECADYVYEYCAIHGPLLVIPDDKVPVHSGFPSYVPRAALSIPHVFLHLAPSVIPGAGLGVFSTLTLPRGVRFGPYRGQRTLHADSMYCWQIYDRNNKPCHVIDALDDNRSNWMRYVNCARHSREQNLVAYQYQGQLYYRTTKIIPRFTELMIFYGSEYANALHINLSKYNSDKFYVECTPYVLPKSNKTSEIFSSETKENIIDNMEKLETSNKKIEDKLQNIRPIETDDTQKYKTEKTTVKVTERKFKCETCNKTYTAAKNLKFHSFSHSTTWRFNCDQCDYKTNRKSNIIRHILTHSKTHKFNCKICFYKTNSKRDFFKHSRLHETKENLTERNKKPPYVTPRQFDICDFKTLTWRFNCDHCDYKTNRRSNIIRHVLTHSKTHKFNCKICFYKTNYIRDFFKHSRLHETKENLTERNKKLPYVTPRQFDICDFETLTWRFNCDHCDYKTNKRYSIIRHIVTHSKTHKFNCKICFYKTNFKRDFTKHSRLHETKENLTELNKRKHYYVTPRQCDICDFKTLACRSFARHKALHEAIIYKCDQCEYSNFLKSNLLRHKKRHAI